MSAATGGDVLATIVAATTRGVELRDSAAARRSLEQAAAAWQPRGAALLETLAAPGRVRVIAECKRRSPSRGILRADYDPAAIARQYAAAGAAAISVLTEPTFFDGALEHLADVRRAVALPLLRKDFIVDEYQVHESRALGADCILLIVACLDDAQLAAFEACAQAHGMEVLVEVHDEAELQRALRLRTPLVGVNNRNLRTFEVSLDTTLALRPRLPADRLLVAESGILAHADVQRLRSRGVHAFLVGEAFMRAPDPGRALAGLFD
jgi:indole-3-glycerol phosphate synthase